MKKLIPILVVLFLLLLATSTIQAQEIFEAVRSNDLTRVKTLIEEDSSLLNVNDENGRTPLHWAARGVHYDIMKYLIEKGADVNASDKNQITPIMSVTTRIHLDAMKLLLNNGAKINVSDYDGDQPIHFAAYYGFKEAVGVFLERGVPIEVKNNYGRTPLLVAARERGDLETIKLLIENGADINAVDAFGDTALSFSAWRGFRDVVDYLISKNAKINITGTEGTNLLMYATTKGLNTLYEAIIQRGGDVFSLSSKGQSALHWAASGESEQIVADLIDRGMPVNTDDCYGWSPLHYAAYFGRLAVVKVLMTKGAKVDAKTPLQETPFKLAKTEKRQDVMEFLTLKGANQNPSSATKMRGKYFGQKDPGTEPKLFAPGIVSRLRGGHSNITFSPDGSEAFWTEWNLTETGYARGCKIWHSKIRNGEWTAPEVVFPIGDTPIFSVDGTKIYFLASLPLRTGETPVRGIWYLEKNNGTWGRPNYLDFDISGAGLYWQFSFDNRGNLYFSGPNGLNRSLYKNGKYEKPERLADIFHAEYEGGAPFISQDGSYIIFNSMNIPESYGGGDLYIGFKKRDGSWTRPMNMGPRINTPQNDHLAMVSGDGKYLFFRSEREGISGIYWVSTKIIDALRPKE